MLWILHDLDMAYLFRMFQVDLASLWKPKRS